ncbi:MAG: hypothetical protein H6738_18035 [Alphaproteobacteria bacterium]|nr:hypothetical protein [Alphaproteobacteria bacterium]
MADDVSTWTSHSGDDLITSHHVRGAYDCVTKRGRQFLQVVERDVVGGLDNYTYDYTIRDVGTLLVFDAAGTVEAIRTYPTCCDGEAADYAWWGDPRHPRSPWCAENPSCDPYDCVELTPDDIRARLENQRR